MNYFVTGTDTGVGKTYVTCLLARSLRRAGLDTVAMKPICCGSRSDAEMLRDAAGGVLSLDDVNPVWLKTPAAPSVAAGIEGTAVDLARIRETFARLRHSHRSLLVEGAGGWRVPMANDFFVSDLARECALPILVVVPNRLGALNHTLLTVERIQADGLSCGGIVLNNLEADAGVAGATNRRALEGLLKVPILFEIRPNQELLSLEVG